jgi:hypothetical protein
LSANHRPSAWAAAILLAACQTPGPVPAETGKRPITGAWGGNHVSLVLAANGGTLEYDCASGSIDGPLGTDARGRFAARGTHIPGQGGPEREGDEPPRLPADYSGEVSGDSMTLLVRVPSAGIEIGPLTLRRGAEANLFRCL